MRPGSRLGRAPPQRQSGQVTCYPAALNRGTSYTSYRLGTRKVHSFPALGSSYPRYQKYLEDGVTGTWLEFFKKEVRQEQAAEAASGCAQIPYVDYCSDCGTFYVGQVEDCSACGDTRIGKATIWNHLKM